MKQKIMEKLIVLSILTIFLSACGGQEPQTAAPQSTPSGQQAPIETPAVVATETASEEVASEPAAQENETQAQEPAQSEAEVAPTALPPIDPATLTLTNAQGEGPYYPITEPPERDNDLTVIAGATQAATGQVIEFSGRVLWLTGEPVAGAVIEIWQTDANGIYMHPGDAGTNNRDLNFQFYGEATADEQGLYSFRTIVPGLYEPRPRHIHFKVKLDGRELLTSQFYFSGDERLGSGSVEEAILLRPETAVDEAGNDILVAQKNIILAGNANNN